MEQAHTLVVLIDDHGRPTAANPAFERLHQWLPSAQRIDELVLPADRPRLGHLIAAAHNSRSAARQQIEFGLPDNVIRCNCLAVAAGRAATLILAEPALPYPDLLAVNADLADQLGHARSALDRKTAELQAVLAQADELAHTDSLTLLPNRRSIIADLQRHVTYAERYETPLAVSMLDLDGFKNVNDEFGHAAGDKVLISAAHGLRDRIRQPDQIGRYGGDEFLVILPNSIAMAASEQASRLCQYVRSTSFSLVEGPAARLALSVGIAQFSSGQDWRALLDRADRALYEAKRQGGDRWLILES
jgi:diguanylate cyclase (GGDEF)-like protein